MSLRIPSGLTALALAGLTLSQVPAQQPQPKPPHWTHAFDLKCRNHKQAVFDEKTKANGFEVFKDENNTNGLYIMQTGVIAAARGFDKIKSPVPESKAPDWLHGLDLKVRKAGEEKFTDKTQVISLEVFRDENTGNWVYITERDFFAVSPGDVSARAPTPSPKAPKWSHGLDLKCRKAGEKEFTNDTKVWSVEVFFDENTGQLIYICETGAVAIAAGTAVPENKGKAPAWLHGLDLKCRKGRTKDFDPTTKTYGMEVFRDENNDNLIYITEVGTLAVVPGLGKGLTAPTKAPREPQWTHGLDLKCRKHGEPEFTAKTQVFGIEVFRDPNTNVTLYISEVCSLTGVPVK